MLVFVMAAGGYFCVRPALLEAKTVAYEKLSDIDENTFSFLSNTVIYDDSDNQIAEIVNKNYEYIPINDVPEYIQHGYIAVEDRRFLSHHGIDYKSLARAVFAMIKNKGRITQGGSTITQQVVKNMLLTQERSYKRKLAEFFIAPEIEKKYSKSDIMEFYVNTCYYGDGCYGIGSAAEYFFGKTPAQLTLGECALFVGLSNNPTAYSPVNNPEKAKERRKLVLSIMLEQGYITQEQYSTADSEELRLVLNKKSAVKENYQTSYAIHCAALKLMELNGFRFEYVFDDEKEYKEYKERYSNAYSAYSNEIRAGGYTIRTTLNKNIQDLLQESIDNGLSEFEETDPVSGKYTMQGASVVIDNATGFVSAIVGGRGIEDEFNRGFLAERQPGSAMKPIGVYGPAIDTGRYYPSLIMTDKYIEGGPKNYTEGVYSGPVTLRTALAKSINTIPFQIMMDIQPSTGLEYLGKMRFDTLAPADNVGSLALGGMTYGTRVCDMAKAYYTVQNGGVYTDSTCIRSIEFQAKGMVFDGTSNLTRVYEQDTAYILADMLKTVATKGTGVEVEGHPTGGKTGTTSDNRDGWYAGFTKQYTAVVWVGYDMPKEIPNLAKKKYAINIWLDFMTKLHYGLDSLEWERPATVVDKYVDKAGMIADYNTGVMDLFSQTLIDRLAEQEKEREADKLKAFAEEWANKDTERRQLAENYVSEYENKDCQSIDDLAEIDRLYQEAATVIALIDDTDSKTSLTDRLNIRKSQLDAQRKPYEELSAKQAQATEKAAENEQKRISTEAENAKLAKQKGEAQADAKLVREANAALNELENYAGVDEHSVELYIDARTAVQACKGLSEYTTLSDRLKRQKGKFEIVKATPVPVTPDPVQEKEAETSQETAEQTIE